MQMSIIFDLGLFPLVQVLAQDIFLVWTFSILSLLPSPHQDNDSFDSSLYDPNQALSSWSPGVRYLSSLWSTLWKEIFPAKFNSNRLMTDNIDAQYLRFLFKLVFRKRFCGR